MRSLIYAFAAVAAAGIAYLFATVPPAGETSAETPITATAPANSVMANSVMEEAGSLTLRVDDMHCPFACYPAVKKTLEGQDNVVGVELDQQKEEGTIDNPQVVINYESGFDLTAAMNALSKKGFGKHSIVQ
jgi:periplasmic mercuric ion binding protein